MKLKYYLRGLGVGVICTAIIMGIALSGNKKEALTDAEIIERARLLGMVMEEGEADADKGSSQQEGEPTSQDPNKEAGKDTTKQDSQTNKGETGSDGGEGDKPDTAAQDSGNVGSQSAVNEDGMVELEIKQGEFSDVVSRKLFQAGLIPDADEFNAYMTQKGADDSLRIGVHLIPIDATADEIIEILQEKPQ